MSKLDKLVRYLSLQEAIPAKGKKKKAAKDIVPKDKEDDGVGIPEEAKSAGNEPVHPFKGGATIGRARANLLDQYDREEIDDPRTRLELIDKLIDDLLSNWTSNSSTMQHGEMFKVGMDHGYTDRSSMLGQIKQIDDIKRKKAEMEMMKNIEPVKP